MVTHDAESLARRGDQQENVAIAFLVLVWVFVALRIWTRGHVIRNFGWDDGTMVLATVVFTVYCATMIFLHANGGGTHVSSVSQLVFLTKWTIVGEATYLLTIMILKLSLGIFFARIVVKQWHLWTIYVAVCVNILSSASSFFYALLRCGGNLDEYVYRQLENKCTPRNLDRFFAYQQAGLTTFTDCVFLVLPVFILWNATMDMRSKISVGFILSLAALGCICSIIRFQYVDGLTQIEDFYWNATNIAIWSTIEPGAGIVAGCLATLRPFLKKFIATAQSIRSSSSKSADQSSRSFRSNIDSSKRRTTMGSNVAVPPPEAAWCGRQSALPATEQVIELKADLIRHGGSTERMLHQGDENGNWQRRSTEHDLGLQSTRTRSTRTNRSKADSDMPESERPLPPLPRGYPQQGDNFV